MQKNYDTDPSAGNQVNYNPAIMITGKHIKLKTRVFFSFSNPKEITLFVQSHM